MKLNLPPREHPVSPEHPSRRAMSRVTNPLPAPTVCPYCAGAVHLVGNETIYGMPYGDWPWAYRCTTKGCDAYVGLHPFTNIPLGTLANRQLREARKQAKNAFNPLWQVHGMRRKVRVDRSQAYAWLAQQLAIPPEQCHFGWFNLEQCAQALAVCLSGSRP